MKPITISWALAVAACTAIASPYAAADDAGWYGGANVGRSKAKIDDTRISSALLGDGFATSSINDDNRGTGYKLFGGYQFNRNFAVEGGYFDLGKFGFTATTLPPGSLTGNIKLRGLNLDTVGILPLTESLSVFGRLGVNYAEARDHFTGTGFINVPTPAASKREANYKFGLGLQYAFTEALGMRVEAERYRVNDAVGNKGDVDMLSVGLIYRFGGKAASAPARASAPQYEEPQAAPPAAVIAQVAPPPSPPAPTKVSFSADSLFDFNMAIVKPEGKQALDKFASELKGTDFDVITVTGHTDRIGTHAFNMKLSARRAEAVKTHLVESAGIPAAKVAAKGVDGSDPVTKPGECKGEKATKKLIACLQPDRRVDVEVSGTK
ncbi:outer membrane beta-barrel protein [Undibacterium sp.]|jgi:OOP family OmpA-OmpF porin|uniref:outer membrane beta-barrel protein n=1 Tax=Undibacterium sp. TaxID=1914977 RepID=UPI002CDEEEA3|nr:outer membrane beta-barrel protein [Undibacterium sp.]HTD06119.1 outer membrane beta-barrel protein [Undibacterium sp.]